MAAEAFVYVENYFLARVISMERITPSMIRIRIGGEGLRGRISSPMPTNGSGYAFRCLASRR